mgnify:CR=1 FL=1
MKRLQVINFRCYSDLTVEFKPKINLFIGDNSTGKTSLLKACKYAFKLYPKVRQRLTLI